MFKIFKLELFLLLNTKKKFIHRGLFKNNDFGGQIGRGIREIFNEF